MKNISIFFESYRKLIYEMEEDLKEEINESNVTFSITKKSGEHRIYKWTGNDLVLKQAASNFINSLEKKDSVDTNNLTWNTIVQPYDLINFLRINKTKFIQFDLETHIFTNNININNYKKNKSNYIMTDISGVYYDGREVLTFGGNTVMLKRIYTPRFLFDLFKYKDIININNKFYTYKIKDNIKVSISNPNIIVHT